MPKFRFRLRETKEVNSSGQRIYRAEKMRNGRVVKTFQTFPERIFELHEAEVTEKQENKVTEIKGKGTPKVRQKGVQPSLTEHEDFGLIPSKEEVSEQVRKLQEIMNETIKN